MQALDVEDAKDAKRADLLARQKLGAGRGKKARIFAPCSFTGLLGGAGTWLGLQRLACSLCMALLHLQSCSAVLLMPRLQTKNCRWAHASD